MNNNIYNTFVKVIEGFKKDKNVKSIIHVGSSKEKIYEENPKVNDIDLFIILENQEKNQIRKVEKIDEIEFDFNYISIKGCYDFIESKTYFFLNIKDGKLLYDENDFGKGILSLCEEKYKEGPNKLSKEEKRFRTNQLLSDISRLKQKDEYEEFEYDFLIYMYLNKIIKMYYLINDIWLPKDKKLLKSLKMREPTLYKLICNVNGSDKYKKIIKVTDYILKNL
ncbi:hypothetical protein [Terrisporobacter mayombei]|uniref:Nucleotidyltransferase domain-containing protein n=1 Tax=Terrisporobacter mayombei TaxID=1541 RepID=A0ABY9PWX9_9FIRM|nr:hypothetical protein [Terrisporobacter mayombei]MCC3869864.1 hypothetical protein [Terrisporobacter mayombei]WMT79753.1 hypothetical protein TEMA_00180 [Terrisporobacter mayombei]